VKGPTFFSPVVAKLEGSDLDKILHICLDLQDTVKTKI
jgi:hypothetical protein